MKRTALFAAAVLMSFCCSRERPVTVFQVPADYRSWQQPLDEELDYPVPGHGPTYRIIYANALAAGVKINSPSGKVFPEGAIIVKEVYQEKKDAGKKAPALTIMVKRSGAPDSQDGWLYYMRTPGMAPVQVHGILCRECHEAANEMHPYFDKNKKGIFRDYVFSPTGR